MFDHRGEGRLARDARFRSRAFGACQHAERNLGGEQFVLGQSAMVGRVAHCSRHAFNLIIARRIQLFIVPSGTFMRCARSS